MASVRHVVRRGIVPAVLAAVFGLLFASPVAAHAELVHTNPSNGARLSAAPAKVTLTFSESVELITEGSGWSTRRVAR
jgi:copper transport protein